MPNAYTDEVCAPVIDILDRIREKYIGDKQVCTWISWAETILDSYGTERPDQGITGKPSIEKCQEHYCPFLKFEEVPDIDLNSGMRFNRIYLVCSRTGRIPNTMDLCPFQEAREWRNSL